MFKALFVLAVVISASLTATAADYAYPESYKVSYTIDDSTNGSDRIYYNCDSVESKTESLLKQLGAEHVRVNCTGGLDQFTSFAGPAYVTAKFVAPTMVKNNRTPRLASVKEVNLRSYDDCHFMKSTLEGLQDTLELNVVSGPNTCWSGHSTSNFVISVLAFDN